jgi:acyl carrier protein
MPSVADRVRRFIIDDLGWEGTADELPGDLPLIRAGVLDSLAVLMLVQFLESTYGIANIQLSPAVLFPIAQRECRWA